MSTCTTTQTFEEFGVSIEVDPGTKELVWRAPIGVMTPELENRLRKRKQRIMAELATPPGKVLMAGCRLDQPCATCGEDEWWFEAAPPDGVRWYCSLCEPLYGDQETVLEMQRERRWREQEELHDVEDADQEVDDLGGPGSGSETR